MGNLFTGSDTDPNTGPLVILLAAAMVPTVVASREAWRSPAGEVVRRSPAAAVLGVAALGAALALSASYPVAAEESTGSAMAGMAMSGSGAGTRPQLASQSATADTCVPHQVGLKIAGLDLANTPYMIMSGTNGMDMNGADAAPRPGSTRRPRLALHGPGHPAGGGPGAAGRRQQRAGRHPHGGERLRAAADRGRDIGAEQYVQATSEAVSAFATPAAAEAAGYVPASPTGYPVVTT